MDKNNTGSLGCFLFLLFFFAILIAIISMEMSRSKTIENLDCLTIVGPHVIRDKYLLSSPLKIGFKLHSSSNCFTDYKYGVCDLFLSQNNTNGNAFYLKSHQRIEIDKKSIVNTEFQITISPAKYEHHSFDNLPSELTLELSCNSKTIETVKIPLATQIFSHQVLENYRKHNPDLSNLNILIIGNVGSGKSTLVNSFYTSLSDQKKYTVPALINNDHTTVEISRLRLNLIDYASDTSVVTNISLVDTVGISKHNYGSRETISMLLRGENPNMFLEGEIKKTELDIKRKEDRLRELDIVFELKSMSTEEEYLLNLYFTYGSSEYKQKLERYVKQGDWNSYIENRKRWLEFKKINIDKLVDLENEYKVIDATVKHYKVSISANKEKLSKNGKNKIETRNNKKQIHSVIMLVSQPSIPTDPELQTNIRNVITAISVEHGISPIVGVTHLTTNNETHIVELVKGNCGVDPSNVFLVPFNAGKEKNFEIDKKILSLLLEAIKRANDFQERLRSNIKDEL